jgi:transposase InsO family protein
VFKNPLAHANPPTAESGDRPPDHRDSSLTIRPAAGLRLAPSNSPGGLSTATAAAKYTSAQFASAATELEVRLSQGKSQCWDNAVGETFFATIKAELLDDGVWPTRRSSEAATLEYIESGHNLHRRHSTLGYLSPATYEATATTVDLVA